MSRLQDNGREDKEWRMKVKAFAQEWDKLQPTFKKKWANTCALPFAIWVFSAAFQIRRSYQLTYKFNRLSNLISYGIR